MRSGKLVLGPDMKTALTEEESLHRVLPRTNPLPPSTSKTLSSLQVQQLPKFEFRSSCILNRAHKILTKSDFSCQKIFRNVEMRFKTPYDARGKSVTLEHQEYPSGLQNILHGI